MLRRSIAALATSAALFAGAAAAQSPQDLHGEWTGVMRAEGSDIVYDLELRVDTRAELESRYYVNATGVQRRVRMQIAISIVDGDYFLEGYDPVVLSGSTRYSADSFRCEWRDENRDSLDCIAVDAQGVFALAVFERD